MKMLKESKILIVHHRPQFILALEATLNRNNRVFLNATSALETISMTQIDDVDLIILDSKMEDADIISLTGILKIQDKTKNIPLIILNETPSILEHYFQSWPTGSVDFVQYPIDANKIESSIKMFEKNEFKWNVKVK
ncbi:MAG: response regulator [Bacteroidota bacterium]